MRLEGAERWPVAHILWIAHETVVDPAQGGGEQRLVLFRRDGLAGDLLHEGVDGVANRLAFPADEREGLQLIHRPQGLVCLLKLFGFRQFLFAVRSEGTALSLKERARDGRGG